MKNGCIIKFNNVYFEIEKALVRRGLINAVTQTDLKNALNI